MICVSVFALYRLLNGLANFYETFMKIVSIFLLNSIFPTLPLRWIPGSPDPLSQLMHPSCSWPHGELAMLCRSCNWISSLHYQEVQ
jgi:hypothetical protein